MVGSEFWDGFNVVTANHYDRYINLKCTRCNKHTSHIYIYIWRMETSSFKQSVDSNSTCESQLVLNSISILPSFSTNK